MTNAQFAFVLYTAAHIRAADEAFAPAHIPHGEDMIADRALEAAMALLRRAEHLREKYSVDESVYALLQGVR